MTVATWASPVLMPILCLLLLISLLLPLLIFPEAAAAAVPEQTAPHPYARSDVWLGAAVYAIAVILAALFGFRNRFSRRQGGTTVHDDLWRKFEEKGGPQA